MRKYKVFTITIILVIILESILVQDSVFCETEDTLRVNLNNYIRTDGCRASNKNIEFFEDSTISYSVFIPFYSDSIRIHANSDSKLGVKINDMEFEIITDRNGIGEYTFDTPLYSSSYSVTLSSRYANIVNSVDFIKEKISLPTQYEETSPNLSDFELKICTAVILHNDSSVMMVNGSKRYINRNNIHEKPLIFEGKMYLEISLISRSLGYYSEDIPEKGYSLLRYGTTDYIVKNGRVYKNVLGCDKEETNAICVYKNGKTYLPIRYFAEETGKKVAYKNKMVVIDYSRYVNDILQKATFNRLADIFDEYINENVILGTVYHVAKSNNASDKNVGSEKEPFLTLEKAAEVAEGGDTVIVHTGKYRETLIPKNNGTPMNPIIFKAAEGENVIISANETVNGFYIDEGKIVCARCTSIGKGRDMVFYKDKALTPARYPNTDTSQRYQPKNISDLFMRRGNITISNDDNTEFVSDSDLNQESGFWNGATFVGLVGGGWYPVTAKIESSEKGKFKIGKHTDVWFEYEKNFIDCGYITDTKNAIDIPGEWYVDPLGYLYIIPPTGETIASLSVEMKRRQLVIDLSERKNIIISGIKTIGGGINMNNSEMCTLENNDFEYISNFTFADSQLRGEFDKSYNCIEAGENGIYVSGDNNSIINSKINFSAGYAMYLVGKYTYVENNEISNCGYIGRGGIYISQNPNGKIDDPRGGHFIYSNKIYNTNREAIAVCAYEPWINSEGKLPCVLPIEIAYNDISNTSLYARDSGAIYMHGTVLGSDRAYTSIHHNYIHDTGNYDSFYADIYFDNHSQYGVAYNNVSYATDKAFDRENIVYIQNHPYYVELGAIAYAKDFNNKSIGCDELTDKKFPSELPFYAGIQSNKFKLNYERYKD